MLMGELRFVLAVLESEAASWGRGRAGVREEAMEEEAMDLSALLHSCIRSVHKTLFWAAKRLLMSGNR